MSDQTTPEPLEDDDEFPPVKFSMRNIVEGSSEVQLSNHLLGLGFFALLQADEEGFTLETAHVSFDDLAGALAIVLGSMLQSDEIGDETRDEVIDLISSIGEEA